MKKFIIALTLILIFAMPAMAYYHHGGGGSRTTFSIWLGPIYPFPYPYYYAPPPPVYVVPVPVAPAPEPNYWYYCPNPQGYYPYVQTCPGGWMKVVPEPRK